ncbi:hypothetical protein ACLKA7_005605, partial [Drosophila subpalustris]
MRDATASCVVSFLVQEVFLKFGVPEVIHSDNGRQFTGKVFEEMTQAYGMRADRQRLIQEKIQKQLHASYERSSLRYNERARELYLTPGQEVLRRNFSLSNFSKAYNAKFAR